MANNLIHFVLTNVYREIIKAIIDKTKAIQTIKSPLLILFLSNKNNAYIIRREYGS